MSEWLSWGWVALLESSVEVLGLESVEEVPEPVEEGLETVQELAPIHQKRPGVLPHEQLRPLRPRRETRKHWRQVLDQLERLERHQR